MSWSLAILVSHFGMFKQCVGFIMQYTMKPHTEHECLVPLESVTVEGVPGSPSCWGEGSPSGLSCCWGVSPMADLTHRKSNCATSGTPTATSRSGAAALLAAPLPGQCLQGGYWCSRLNRSVA